MDRYFHTQRPTSNILHTNIKRKLYKNSVIFFLILYNLPPLPKRLWPKHLIPSLWFLAYYAFVWPLIYTAYLLAYKTIGLLAWFHFIRIVGAPLLRRKLTPLNVKPAMETFELMFGGYTVHAFRIHDRYSC